MTIPPDAPDGSRAKRNSYVGGVTDGNLIEPMELSDFLHGVGTVFRLPEHAATAKAEPPAVGAPRRRRQAIAVALALLTTLGLLAFRFWPRSEPHLPAAVLGDWTTDDPRYAGRVLRIRDHEVAFVVAGQETKYPVAHVRRRQAGDTAYLTVEYLVAGRKNAWPVAFVPGPSPSLLPVNQPGLLWTR